MNLFNYLYKVKIICEIYVYKNFELISKSAKLYSLSYIESEIFEKIKK